MTSIDPDALTWTGLLARWIEFAQASVAVPEEEELRALEPEPLREIEVPDLKIEPIEPPRIEPIEPPQLDRSGATGVLGRELDD